MSPVKKQEYETPSPCAEAASPRIRAAYALDRTEGATASSIAVSSPAENTPLKCQMEEARTLKKSQVWYVLLGDWLADCQIIIWNL